MENKSRREGENILARLSSSVVGIGVNQIAKNQENHTMTITSELKQKLEMVRNLLNLGTEISYDELLHKMAEALFESKSPAPARVDSRQDILSRSRYIPKSVKSAVYIRERGRCSYISKLTGKQCSETRHLHYEHCRPFALGGENKVENITLLCRAHNSLRAVESFGAEKMQKYLPSLRL